MLQYEVDFLVGAEKDMLKIADYISNELYNPDSAMRLIDKFEKAKNSLMTLPERHPVHESNTVKTTFRKMLVANYVIFYILESQKFSGVKIGISRFFTLYFGINVLNF